MDENVTLDTLTRRKRKRSAYATARDKWFSWCEPDWEKVYQQATEKLSDDPQWQEDLANYHRETKAISYKSKRPEPKMADDGL